MSNSIISLWSGPRNVSTALMYSFAQRDDTKVVDEPLYAHYLKVTGFEHPGREEVLSSQENEGRKVIEQIFRKEVSDKNLFIKNMAKHLIELDREFLSELKNILLIRDPKEMLPSFLKQVKEPTLQETALKDQLELMEELIAREIPVVIVNSKDLLLDPEGTLRELCRFTGLEFQNEMLAWEAGPRPEDGIWAKYWYHNVHKSTGFGIYEPKEAQIEDEFQPFLEECQHYYYQLNSHSTKKSTK